MESSRVTTEQDLASSAPSLPLALSAPTERPWEEGSLRSWALLRWTEVKRDGTLVAAAF